MTFIRKTVFGLGLIVALAATAQAQQPRLCSDALADYSSRQTLAQRAAFVNNDSLDICDTHPRDRIIPVPNTFIRELYNIRDSTKGDTIEVQRFGTVTVVIEKDMLTLVAGDLNRPWQSYHYTKFPAAIQLANTEPIGSRKLPDDQVSISIYGRRPEELNRLNTALNHVLEYSGDTLVTSQNRQLLTTTIQAVRLELTPRPHDPETLY